MGDEELLWSAVSEAVAPIVQDEKEWDANKLEKKIREYFKKSAKTLAFSTKTWQQLVNDYADNVFSAMFSSIGDRQWLYMGQADFLLCIDAAIKDFFPAYLLKDVTQQSFEQTVLSAHDRAFEEQRYYPTLWEVIRSIVQGEKGRKKVYNALDLGRKEAADIDCGLNEFVSNWIRFSIARLNTETQGDLEGVLDLSTACKVFHVLIEKKTLPTTFLNDNGQPPAQWHLVDDAVQKAYLSCGAGARVQAAGNSGAKSRSAGYGRAAGAVENGGNGCTGGSLDAKGYGKDMGKGKVNGGKSWDGWDEYSWNACGGKPGKSFDAWGGGKGKAFGGKGKASVQGDDYEWSAGPPAKRLKGAW